MKLVSTGRKTFDVRLHCANSPCDQTTRLPQHLGKVQKRDTARLLRNFLVLKTIAISASGPSYNVYLVGNFSSEDDNYQEKTPEDVEKTLLRASKKSF